MYELSKSAEMTIKDLEESGRRVEDIPLEFKLFLYGVKPALAISEWSFIREILVNNYLSIMSPSNYGSSAVIFQDAHKFYDYVQKAKVREVDHRLWKGPRLTVPYKDLGIALGYPPSACAWFAEYMKREDSKQEGKRIVYYHGMQFVTHESLVVDNINWLRENMLVPEHLRGEEYVSLPRKQIDDPVEVVGTFDDILSSSLDDDRTEEKNNDN